MRISDWSSDVCSSDLLDHLRAATLCKTGQVAELPLARLVGGRDPGIDGGALSQLNLPEIRARKPLLCVGSVLSKTDFCSMGTSRACRDAISSAPDSVRPYSTYRLTKRRCCAIIFWHPMT